MLLVCCGWRILALQVAQISWWVEATDLMKLVGESRMIDGGDALGLLLILLERVCPWFFCLAILLYGEVCPAHI